MTDAIDLGKLKSQIKEKAEQVASTFGPNGQNVLINDSKMPYFTQDGFRVIEEMAKRDKTLAAKLLTDAARQVAFTAGDGTTTTCLLVAKALERGLKLSDYPVSEFVRPLSQKPTKEDILEVASVAAKDFDVGKEIGELIWRLGADGYVTSTPSTEFKTELIPGYELKGGAILPQALGVKHAMVSNGLNHITVYNPMIVMVAHTLSGVKSLNSIFQAYHKATNGNFNRPLVLVFADIEGQTVQFLGTNTGRFPIIAVGVEEKQPTKRHDIMTDLAYLTDCQIYSKLTGRTISNSTGEGFDGQFGTCREVMIDMETARFVCDKDASKLVDKIKALPESETNKERISLLNGATGLIHIGAPTMAQMRNLELAVEDAARSAQSALKEGWLYGGPQLWTKIGIEFPDLAPICEEISKMLPGGDPPKDSVLAIVEAYKTAASLVDQLSNAKYII